MDTKQLLKHRILFYIQGCEHCLIYKKIIGNYNMRLPVNKQIHLINCTLYHDWGIIEHPLIRVYKKYLNDTYPTLFFEGIKINGASSIVETEAFLRKLVEEDFIVKEYNEFSFKKNCYYKDYKGDLGKKLVCE